MGLVEAGPAACDSLAANPTTAARRRQHRVVGRVDVVTEVQPLRLQIRAEVDQETKRRFGDLHQSREVEVLQIGMATSNKKMSEWATTWPKKKLETHWIGKVEE